MFLCGGVQIDAGVPLLVGLLLLLAITEPIQESPEGALFSGLLFSALFLSGFLPFVVGVELKSLLVEVVQWDVL